MLIHIKDYLTPEEMDICLAEGRRRVDLQLKDLKRGNKNASGSYGKANSLETRDEDRRKRHAIEGTITECLAAKLTKTDWTKVIGQYKKRGLPDLYTLFNNALTPTEVRGGSRYHNRVIIRDNDFRRAPNVLLVAACNLPGPVKIGYLTIEEISKIFASHTAEYIEANWFERGYLGGHFHKLPFEFFHDDFSVFTTLEKEHNPLCH